MKNQIRVITLFFLLTTGAYAQNSGFGVGVIVGEPTGLSLKGWLTETTAIDAGVAWSWSGGNSFHLHADYLLHNYNIFQPTEGQLPVYYGIGGRIKFRDNASDKFGMRIPIGIAYQFADAPLDVFLEVVPILDFAPKTQVDLNAAVGLRYYFS